MKSSACMGQPNKILIFDDERFNITGLLLSCVRGISYGQTITWE